MLLSFEVYDYPTEGNVSGGCIASHLLDRSLGTVDAFCQGFSNGTKAVNHLFANSMQLICRVIKEKGFVEKVVGATEDARKNECESIEKDNDLS